MLDSDTFNIERLKQYLKKEWEHRCQLKAKYLWEKIARPNQLIPSGNWRTWLIMAGRGFGKTRTGAETIRQWVKQGIYKRIALIANTESEGRDVMIEGVSGLLDVHPKNERPIFEPSKRRLTWPNGAIATLFSAENTEQLRGPQFDCAWIDELAKFRTMEEVWDQLNFGLRLGPQPRVLITTTPRPSKLIKKLLDSPKEWLHITQGSTFDNAQNLSPKYLEEMKNRYEGSKLGAQELHGKILSHMEGALWTYTLIDSCKIDTVPQLQRVIVAIDPAVTSHGDSDETGIVVAGLDSNQKAFVLADLSGRYKPSTWAQKALEAFHFYQADTIVAEVNQGGDLVASMISTLDASIPFKAVHATRGKAVRAEPVASLYEQGRIFHHRFGKLEVLEDQMCSFIPASSKKSPDRMDALVWAITELCIKPQPNLQNHFWTV